MSVDQSLIVTASDIKAIEEGCWFDGEHADWVVKCFQTYFCPSTGDGAGLPLQLMPWQIDKWIRPLYGWKRKNGKRRFEVAYVEIPKKNGKSTIFSAMSIFHLAMDGEEGAMVYGAAMDRDQANLVYKEAVNMVNYSPELKRRLHIEKHRHRINYHARNSTYQTTSSEAGKWDGINASCILFDELHRQKTRAMWDALRYAGAARSQPLLIAITTAGDDRESICWEQHQYAADVLSGRIIDTSFFPLIYAADPDKFSDPAEWEKANPSWGVTINPERFAREFAEASKNPRKLAAFKRLRLNIWTESANAWLDKASWAKCEHPDGCDLEPDADTDVWIGCDLANTQDVAAVVMVWRSDGIINCKPFLYCPEDKISQREESDRVSYRQFIERGELIATPGNRIDYNRIRDDILELCSRYMVRGIAFDPWNAEHMIQMVEESGEKAVRQRTGFASMSTPSKRLESMIESNTLRHNGNSMLSWMASNVVAEEKPTGDIKPSKKLSREKIDGIVALIVALAIEGLDQEQEIDSFC